MHAEVATCNHAISEMMLKIEEKKGKRRNWVFVTFDKYFILTKRILEGTYKCQL